MWAAGKAMELAPLNMLSGSPWAASYLRAAGARVGEACHIGTAQVPLPRFLRLGDGATVGYAVHLNAYDLTEGVLSLGRIDIGAGAVVGANSVLQGPVRRWRPAPTCASSPCCQAGRARPGRGRRWVRLARPAGRERRATRCSSSCAAARSRRGPGRPGCCSASPSGWSSSS